MARQQTHPIAPRIGAPDLPSELEDASARRSADLRRARVVGLAGDVDLEHASLEECRIPSPSVHALALRGATLVDVEITDIRAVSISARDTTIRRLRIAGGRIGTLDLTGARVSELELRDLRIDYLTLAGARAEDVLIGGSAIRALDLPQAQLTRVAFDGSRADEVDPRGMRASDVDLRGLDALAYLDVLALRGTTLSEEQVRMLAPAFATATGIQVRD
ncbi:pentapeptide repeat-containing protein [Microbacterium betulae]|uniref:Pentapeptide repeat-containing protein n=1 Tax=Microbacterium betulae TaxID=2981139 RepID=A0AA97I8K1_9MICO|nr:pentapeptide repeat-containing protein [Microbacterium sp. AB]WOF24585.1 pentapeptide repeat-containing protein [Microbacterium sp. AB]